MLTLNGIFSVLANLGAFGSFCVALIGALRERRKSAKLDAMESTEGRIGLSPLPSSRSAGLRQRVWMIAALVLGVGTILLSGITWYNHTSSSGAAHANTAPAEASADTPNKVIRITDPPKESPPHKVSRILSVTGEGDIPKSHHLWLFAYGSGTSTTIQRVK
jgi:hypothetical protein